MVKIPKTTGLYLTSPNIWIHQFCRRTLLSILLAKVEVYINFRCMLKDFRNILRPDFTNSLYDWKHQSGRTVGSALNIPVLPVQIFTVRANYKFRPMLQINCSVWLGFPKTLSNPNDLTARWTWIFQEPVVTSQELSSLNNLSLIFFDREFSQVVTGSNVRTGLKFELEITAQQRTIFASNILHQR